MNINKIQWYNSFFKILFIITRLLLLLFLYAAISKLSDYDEFKIQISKSPILTDFAGIIVWLIPSIEIIIGLMLVIPRTIMIGLYASLALLSMFTAYIIAILNFSESIPCSCGGVLENMNWQEHLVFNIVFILLAITGILLKDKITQKKLNKLE